MIAVIDPILQWVLGGCGALFLAAVSCGVSAYNKLSDRFSELSTRVTRLEAVMALFGQKAAKLLHSPDDHLGIDNLLDKYLDRNYELTYAEWEALLIACEIIENDTSKSKGERTLAAWLAAVCSHKLHKPPQPRTKHDL